MQKIVYLLISKFFQILPLSSSLFIGRRLGDFTYFILRIRRKVVFQNLRFVFGNQKSEKEIRQIAKRTYQNFGMTLIEFIRFPILNEEYIKNHIKTENVEYLDYAFKLNRGLIVITGHLNNWELMGATYTLQNYPLTVYARALRNKVINDIVNNHRTCVGMQIISKKIAAREVFEELKANHIVGFLIDQDASKHGIFVDFFGKPASTFRGPVAFAVKTKTPILPMFIVRDNISAYHTIYIEPPLLPNPQADEESEVLRLTQAATKILESYIRRYPDQYFWFHKRWKTQPAAAKSQIPNPNVK